MHHISIDLLISSSVFLVCFIQSSIAGTNETDKLALIQIKHKITHDPLGLLNSWNESTPMCSTWYGVSCGATHPRVTSLDLTSAGLKGTISPFIGNLTFLSLLRLKNNTFHGIIPPEIGYLFRLEQMYLSFNSLQGVIPSSISGCESLGVFDVYSNKLVGEIPPEIGSILSMWQLVLSFNSFTGNIPASLGNLSDLSTLQIQQTNVGGNIPDSLGRLKNLVELELDNNHLVGDVPTSIFNLSLLQNLNLGSNQLEGSLPSELGHTLPNLQYLDINKNSFSGSIPSTISSCSNLTTLVMSSNRLQGQVPSLKGLNKLETLVIFDNKLGIGDPNTDLDFVSSLANSTNLTRFIAGNNNFSGTFPRVFCNFSKLSILIAGENQMTGEIPSCIGNLEKLTIFDVRENNLFGVIPESIGRLHNVFQFFVYTNQLSGQIPSSVGNMTLLTYFMLSQNNFHGQIPSSLGNCDNLLALDLASNNLSGEIPQQILRLSSLSNTLDLSNNRLSGPLLDDVGGLVNLQTLHVFDNLLSGEIPTTLGSCIELEELHMQGNFFQGVIPETLSSLASLKILDLSRNNISGNIPDFLQHIHLQMLNLSYNNLEGEVPTSGVFRNSTGVSLVGNSMLCGGLEALQLKECRFGHKNHTKMIILFGISGFILLVAFLVSLCIMLRKKKTKKEVDSNGPDKTLTNLSYQMLHRATSGFSSENLLGSGASGVVYKGTLEEVGTLLAIKIFNLEHRRASKSFITECNALRNIRHRNLIKVITVCSSLDYKGNDFKALVYEYMPNGSLDDWLHPKQDNNNNNNVSRDLNIGQRFEIAVDVGLAMEYLHHNIGSSVIHCDLKPSNVLLDEDMVAHVGDFGLAKLLSEDSIGSGATQSSSTGVRGTVGYAPPEYGIGSEVWTQGDVYSFGILLLEMFTGKRPTDDNLKKGMNLRDVVKEALSEEDVGIVDDPLLQEMSTEDSSSQVVFQALISVLEIGLTCSSELPRERPDMSEVVVKLSAIRTKLLGHHMRQLRGTYADS